MKTIINDKEIWFKYLLFTIIIPNNKNIEYRFEDLRFDIGAPITLRLKSKETRIISRLGIFGKILYYIASTFVEKMLNDFTKNDSLTTVCGRKNTEKFLNDLHEHNYYNADKQIEEFKKIIKKQVPEYINQNYKWINR